MLTRYSGNDEPRRVISIATDNGGRHWGKPAKSSLKNPDAAIDCAGVARWKIARRAQ